jgi:hypothetical protein
MARLAMSYEESLKYVPPAGLNVSFLEWLDEQGKTIEEPQQIIMNAKQVVIEYLCTDKEPDPVLNKSMNDIRHELGTTWRNRLLEDNLSSHPQRPRKGMMVEINLGSTLLKDAPEDIRRAADAATDIHDIEVSPYEAEHAKVESTGKRLPFVQPRAVVQDKILQQQGPEKGVVEVLGPERYRYKMGVLDIG